MFKFLPDGSILDVENGCVIPAVEGNADYDRVQAWVADGHEIAPADEVVEATPLIDTVSEETRQVLLALRDVSPAAVEAWFDANVKPDDPVGMARAMKQLGVALSIIRQQIKGAR